MCKYHINYVSSCTINTTTKLAAKKIKELKWVPKSEVHQPASLQKICWGFKPPGQDTMYIVLNIEQIFSPD